MVHPAPRTLRLVLAGGAGLVVAFGVLLRAGPGDAFVIRAIDDIGQSFAAALGAAGCGWRARRSIGRWRLSWALIGAALACWAAGELVWSYYEVVARRETPFPSPADLGFLLFPLLALPGLLVRPSTVLAGRGRLRVVLDGAMVAGSLFCISWATSLGTVYHSDAQSTFAFVVSLAYPASDLVMLTVATSVLAHSRSRSGYPLPLLVLGLASMALADSGFSYLTAVGAYRTGSVVDIAWFAAFLLIGIAAVVEPAGAGTPLDDAAPGVESPVFLTLPYVLVVIGGAAEAVAFSRGEVAPVTLLVQVGAIAALLLRQLLTVLDNRRLALDVMVQREELRFRAFHDALTGLANRALFHDRVAHALELHQRDRRPVSVLFCDLDDFKAVNDSLGHQAGDELLVGVAERLRATLRAGDTVARLGGDEFAVLLEDDADVEALSARILGALGEPMQLSGHPVAVRASMGSVSVGPDDVSVTTSDLLKRADVAMYAAKRAGKGMVLPFTNHLVVRASTDLDERVALSDDIGAGRIQAAFQPIVAPDGHLFAVEALARWRRAGVEVAPSRFVELAERAGLLADLDTLVIDKALAYAVASLSPDVLVSVNLGLPSLRDPRLPSRLLGLLGAAGLTCGRLIVEVPETHALDSSGALDVLGGLRDAGFAIAVDDFGVGYSNLARLADLAPHIIKLDKSLVDPLGTAVAADRIVAGIIDLAHDLDALVVAEGVETEQQRDVLRGLGCDALQGFLVGRPVVPDGLRLHPAGIATAVA